LENSQMCMPAHAEITAAEAYEIGKFSDVYACPCCRIDTQRHTNLANKQNSMQERVSAPLTEAYKSCKLTKQYARAGISAANRGIQILQINKTVCRNAYQSRQQRHTNLAN